MSNQQKIYPIWDFPTRLFHWSLVLLFFGCWVTFELGEMDYHGYMGYAILVLILFRLSWGVIGSRHSRFSDFVKGPRAMISYLKSGKSESVGHNPLGAWSVITLLCLILVQTVTGLVNTDDIIFSGPYNSVVNSDQEAVAGWLHQVIFYGLLGVILLHVASIVFYQFVKKQPLFIAMITGFKKNLGGKEKPAPMWLAFLITAVAAGLVYLLVHYAPKPAASIYGF